jgi:transcriptional regulator with XRE-family HTH domain
MRNKRQAKVEVNAEGFPERMRQLRRQKNMSQLELATAVGVHFTQIGRYERGESQPSAEVFARIATTLGVSTDYLIEGTSHEGATAKARFEDRELLAQFQEVERLPEQDKAVIKNLLDAFLVRRKVREMTH